MIQFLNSCLSSAAWLRGVQAMCTLGLLSAIMSGVCLVIWIVLQNTHFSELHPWHTALWQWCRGIASIGTAAAGESAISGRDLDWFLNTMTGPYPPPGILGLLGVIIYGSSYKDSVTAETSPAPSGWCYWLMVLVSIFFALLGALLSYLALTSPDLCQVSPEKPSTPKRSPTPCPPTVRTPTPAPAMAPPMGGEVYSFMYQMYPHNSPMRATRAQREHEKLLIDGNSRTQRAGKIASIPENTAELEALTSGPLETSRGLSSMTSISRLYGSVLAPRDSTETPTPVPWSKGEIVSSRQSTWRGQQMPPKKVYTV